MTLPVNVAARRRVGRHAHLHRALDLGELLLGDVEVHVDRVERMERDDRVAVVHVLAQVHRADAEPAGERRADRLLGDRRPRMASTSPHGLLGRGLAAVEIRLGDHALRLQIAGAHEVQARELRLRFRRAQLRLLGRRVEADEDLALGRGAARGERDLADGAGQLRAQLDALDRA